MLQLQESFAPSGRGSQRGEKAKEFKVIHCGEADSKKRKLLLLEPLPVGGGLSSY